MSGSCPHACEYPSEVQRIPGDGVFEGKEQSDDLRQAREFRVQVLESTLLGDKTSPLRGNRKKKCGRQSFWHPFRGFVCIMPF